MAVFRHRIISAILLSACICYAQGSKPPSRSLPSAESIMARVAANQDTAVAEREHYIYVQHAKMTSRRGKTVMCEEITDYRFTPSSDGTRQHLLKLDGKYLKNDKYVTYTSLLSHDEHKDSDQQNEKTKEKSSDKKDERKNDKSKQQDSDLDPDNEETIDRDIVENIRGNLIHEKSKDGINARLFPLTSKDQSDYVFRMIGRERLNDRDVYHIAFRPKDKDDFGWSGDAFIDTTDYQPVLVTTAMSRKVPFAVRTLLGTNVPGLGFTVTYAPQPDGSWFPVTFSTEFKIHVLYFFHREVILNAENRNFEKTHVTSRIIGEALPVEDTGNAPAPPPQ